MESAQCQVAAHIFSVGIGWCIQKLYVYTSVLALSSPCFVRVYEGIRVLRDTHYNA